MNKKIRSERGVLVLEWLILTTIVVIGLVAAISAMRDSTNFEYAETANAVLALQTPFVNTNPATSAVNIPIPQGTGNYSSGGMINTIYPTTAVAVHTLSTNTNPVAN